MIKKKILCAVLIVFIAHFIGCSPCTTQSILQPNSETPLKVLLISDCSITSIPDQQFEENISLSTIQKLKHALQSTIQKKGNVEFIKVIDNVGIGSNLFNQQSSVSKNRFSIDSVISSPDVNDSIQSGIKKITRYICHKGYFCLTGSITIFDLEHSFSEGKVFQKIQLLKTTFDADYCIVNSISGTVRRKSIPTATKVGVAVATGLISLLSPIGGVMVIPGDETELKSYSFLINLNTGHVEWLDSYFSWQLNAVENANETHWAEKTFKKFDIQMKVCPGEKTQNGR